MSYLTSNRVEALLFKVLPADAEMSSELVEQAQAAVTGAADAPEGFVIAHGIIRPFLLHVGRLREHEAEIRACLQEMPDSFHLSGGGGMSFLNACVDRHDNHWGEPPDMEALFVLGAALGLVKYPMPREMWSVLPSGMPYVQIDLSAKGATP